MVGRLHRSLWACLLAGGLLGSCVQEGIDAPAALPDADFDYFRCRVQPVLAQSCAFMDCHGNETRPLRIYAEQRFRLDVEWLDFETPITMDEISANYTAARGFLGSGNETNLLSEKPLDVRAGGLFHGADGLYGPGDVFRNQEAPEYEVLRAFGEGAREAADCLPGLEPLP